MFPPDEQNFAQKDLKVQQRVTVKNTILYLVEAAASDFRPRLGKGRTLETAKFLSTQNWNCAIRVEKQRELRTFSRPAFG